MPVPAYQNPVLQDHPKCYCILFALMADPRLFAMPTLVKLSRLAEVTGTDRTDVNRLLALLVAEGYVLEVRRTARGSPWLMLANMRDHPAQRAA